MAGRPGGRSVAAAWESAPAAAACGGLSVAALSSVPGSLATASVAVGRWSFLALVGGPVVALTSSSTFSGGLTVKRVSEVSGGLACAAAVVVASCVRLALLGGPLVLLSWLPLPSDGLPVAVESAESGGLTLAAAVVVGSCVFLALVGGPSAPLAALLRLAAVCPPLRIMAALPRV